MAGSIANAHETEILQWSLGGAGVNPTRPTAWYIGLFTDAAGLVTDQPGTEATAATCPGYARQQCNGWTISGNSVQNTNAIPDFTASGAWPSVSYFGIFSAPTGGTLLYWGSIPTKTLANADKLSFGAGQIVIMLD